ncbi:hypothetical protein A3K72_04090 [Candidatus Woesearchaeota archaeon RBG_13_36_6]|nr:MAG: hypothetical protein A3K72_04090 [Candidatus Woesearchaeota archaeon RBG_13_36_6]
MRTEFKCLHSGKCCEKVYTQISLTLGDIIRIAHFLDWPVEKLFEQNIVGIKPFGVSENVFEYELGLTIPCKFRINKRCKIYEARPLNCRLFPYWLLAEVSQEKIKKLIDKSYECVHSVKLNEETKTKYRQYKDKIVEILNKEAEVTDRILEKHKLKYLVDISKQKGFEEVLDEIKQLEKRFPGIELQKAIDGVKISFAIRLLDKSKYKSLGKAIVKEIKNANLEASSTSLDGLRFIEAII